MRNKSASCTPFLDKYTENLNEKIAGRVQEFKVIGRDKEVSEVTRALLRMNKNSPLLIGEAGVGKTAIVEGFAADIVREQVPERFSDVIVRNLELSSLMGDEDGGFLVKFKAIVNELKLYKSDNLCFIDEIHTLMGAGQEKGAIDAANIIKPVLARGEIQLIGATTLDEFHDYIEEDKAMERRFQRIMVNEPTEDEAIVILEGVSKKLAHFHQVKVKKSAVRASVDLAVRFIPELYLPDKAIDLLDITCSKAAQEGRSFITNKDIAAMIQETKGIPVTTILRDEDTRLNDLESLLQQRVMGQDKAIGIVADAIRIARSGLHNLNRPVGSFFLLGTTGVGKTELAKTVAVALFGNENAMIRIDMSEYSQTGDSKKLIGDKKTKGVLTEAVKNHPYSVVLFDEMEKGNRETHDLLLQILDDGRLTDARGRSISFKNTVVFLTTNTGATVIKDHFDLQGSEMTERSEEDFLQRITLELERDFRPEFLNRIGDKVVFNMLDKAAIRKIAVKNLDILQERLQVQGAQLNYEEDLLSYLVDNGSDKSNGARPIERFIKKKVTAKLAKILLENTGKACLIRVKVHGQAPSMTEAIDRRALEFEVKTMAI
ncbi:ATP-dependent Clp protease ATP-binding subunit [Lactococcus garvieae]|uniref:AAA family ATPase n=1 Tax=Lactococcus garvieae TaxID=1363 RepID=UPI0032542A44